MILKGKKLINFIIIILLTFSFILCYNLLIKNKYFNLYYLISNNELIENTKKHIREVKKRILLYKNI